MCFLFLNYNLLHNIMSELRMWFLSYPNYLSLQYKADSSFKVTIKHLNGTNMNNSISSLFSSLPVLFWMSNAFVVLFGKDICPVIAPQVLHTVCSGKKKPFGSFQNTWDTLRQAVLYMLLLLTLTLKVLVTTIDAQWEEMGDVGAARYEPALLPPCPTIRVLSCSN